MKFNAKQRDQLELCIQEIDARTCAEVVFVVRKWSGNYRDVSYLVGALLAWLALVTVLVIPREIPETWIPLPLVFTFWLGTWIASRLPFPRLLTRKKRRILQVSQAAHASFYERKIHQTDAHCGILIYCSRLERRTEIVVDLAAGRALDAAKIEEFNQQFEISGFSRKRFDNLLQTLRSFGLYVGQNLPASALPSAPPPDAPRPRPRPNSVLDEEGEA